MTEILFVDDESSVLDAMKRGLFRDRNRWAMVFVGSGEAALEQLARAHFDIVVTDLTMPGMDGVELLARLERDHPKIVRIALTGNVERLLHAANRVQVHEVLGKPYPIPELRRCLERWEAYALALR